MGITLGFLLTNRGFGLGDFVNTKWFGNHQGGILFICGVLFMVKLAPYAHNRNVFLFVLGAIFLFFLFFLTHSFLKGRERQGGAMSVRVSLIEIVRWAIRLFVILLRISIVGVVGHLISDFVPLLIPLEVVYLGIQIYIMFTLVNMFSQN